MLAEELYPMLQEPAEPLHKMEAVGGGEAAFTTTESFPEPPGPVQVRVYVYVVGPVRAPVDCELGVVFVPDQEPEAVQEVTMPMVDHESVAEPLCAMAQGPFVPLHCMSTVGAGGGVTVTVTESFPLPPGPEHDTV